MTANRTYLGGQVREGKPLGFSTVIADGVWHRVGFTWDRANHALCADGAEVAWDGQTALDTFTGSLTLGTGAGLDIGVFWMGLTDGYL